MSDLLGLETPATSAVSTEAAPASSVLLDIFGASEQTSSASPPTFSSAVEPDNFSGISTSETNVKKLVMIKVTCHILRNQYSISVVPDMSF